MHEPIIVLDASVAVAWVLPDEQGIGALRLKTHAIESRSAHLVVPPMFWSEVANVLAVAVQRTRVSGDWALAALDALADFQMVEYAVDFRASLATAIAAGLTVYDAQYLVLAIDMGGLLWTLDQRLANAAQQRGITVSP